MESTKPRALKQRKAVLVVHNQDGFLEVFAEHDVDVFVVDRPAAQSVTAEAKTDDLIDLLIPPQFQAVHEPSNRRAIYMPDPVPITPAILIERQADQNLFHALTEMGDLLRGHTHG